MQEEKSQKPKAVGYARVSSKEQEETGYSLPAQEKLFADYSGPNLRLEHSFGYPRWLCQLS